MPADDITLRLLPQDRAIRVARHVNGMDAIRTAGVEMEAVCGGRGRCTSCRVKVLEGEVSEPQHADIARLGEAEVEAGYRLACQLSLLGDASLMLAPVHTEESHQILADGETVYVEVAPDVEKRHVTAEIPRNEEHQTADIEEVMAQLPEPPREIALEALRVVPEALRKAKGEVTVALDGGRVVDVEPGDTVPALYGLALDVGTTTIVAYLMDMHSGRQLAVASTTNPQNAFGGDVMSRISFAQEHTDGTRRLHRKVIEAVNHLVAEVTREAGVRARNIYRAVVAGNTCMLHLVFGIEVRFIGLAPYAPVVRASHQFAASSLRLRIHPEAQVAALPIVAGFVGGDTIGALLASGIYAGEKRSLLIDIGTNGEVVLATPDGLMACSAPAGPAFEGGQILHGMRAAHGAIDRVQIDAEVTYHVIGEGLAQGLCGSGLVDAIAGMLDAGILDASGRFAGSPEVSVALPLQKRFMEIDGIRAFLLAKADDTAHRRDVVLTQKDVRELQLAKGAIRSAVDITLLEAGLKVDALDEVLLAGGFGNFLDKERALRIGLIPPLAVERLRYVGNAAGAGAKLALLSAPLLRRSLSIARSIRHINLAIHPEFETIFIDAVGFPKE